MPTQVGGFVDGSAWAMPLGFRPRFSTAEFDGVRRGMIPHRTSSEGPQRSEEPGASTASRTTEAAR